MQSLSESGAALLDANAVLRYVLNDNKEQAAAVKAVVEEGAYTTTEVLCECVYVLQGRCYGFSAHEIAGALLCLLEDIDCEHRPAMLRALLLYRECRLDFVDCLLAARSEVEKARVVTFDKKLQSCIASL